MREYTEHVDGTITITDNCVFTGKPHSVTVPARGFFLWLVEGHNIQDVLPNTPADDREFLISGISPKGWAQTFGTEES